MPLQFLEFDLSEDSDGLQTWDALASPAAVHTAALLAEVRALLQHLQQHLGPSGALDDGHGWDMDLQIQDGSGQPVPLEAAPRPGARITLALSLSGTGALAEHLSALGAD